jgi:ribosomal protein L11 methyltransferase
MGKSIELSVEIHPIWSEFVSEILMEKIGCKGVVTEEEEIRDDEVIKTSKGLIKGYIPYYEGFELEKVRKILQEEKENLILLGISSDTGSWNLTIKEILDEEWSENWKKYWLPNKIGQKIIVCPSWENYEIQNDEILINLDPGSAFGTGAHPTTKLCIEALEKIILNLNNKTDVCIADIGTGSGILALAGIKLGASSAIGVDNDPSVITTCFENAEKNEISDKCRFFAGTASNIQGKFNIVVSNIIAQVLIEIMKDLSELLKPEGKMILSGIINKKLPDIKESLKENKLKIEDIFESTPWIAVVVSKN